VRRDPARRKKRPAATYREKSGGEEENFPCGWKGLLRTGPQAIKKYLPEGRELSVGEEGPARAKGVEKGTIRSRREKPHRSGRKRGGSAFALCERGTPGTASPNKEEPTPVVGGKGPLETSVEGVAKREETYGGIKTISCLRKKMVRTRGPLARGALPVTKPVNGGKSNTPRPEEKSLLKTLAPARRGKGDGSCREGSSAEGGNLYSFGNDLGGGKKLTRSPTEGRWIPETGGEGLPVVAAKGKGDGRKRKTERDKRKNPSFPSNGGGGRRNRDYVEGAADPYGKEEEECSPRGREGQQRCG